MAFMCKQCHDKAEQKAKQEGTQHPHTWKDHIVGETKLGISYGPCEDCKTVGETVDCKAY